MSSNFSGSLIMVAPSRSRRLFVDLQPIRSKRVQRLHELSEIDRFANATVCSSVITRCQVSVIT